MSPLSQYLYCHKIRHQKDFHFLYVRGFRSVQLRLPLGSQGTAVVNYACSTRSARSGSTWTTTSGVLISNLFVLVMLEATREDFSPAVISYCSSNDCSFSSSTPHSSKRRFTSDLVRTTGSGSSFCDSIRSFNSRECLIQCHICSRRPEYLQPVR